MSHVDQVREPGGTGVVDVWVVVDRAPSAAAPDAEPFGLVTAFCRHAGHPGDVHRCPDWLNR